MRSLNLLPQHLRSSMDLSSRTIPVMVTNGTIPPVATLTANPATVIGPIIIGTIITWMLMGSLIVQTFVFHLNSATEKIKIKLLVFILVFMDLIQTVFMTYETWFYTILNHDNVTVLSGAVTPWTTATIPIMAGLISGTVQLFYAWRIWVLSKQVFMRAMAVLIVLLALGQSLSAIIAASIFSIHPTQTNLLKLHPVFDFWLAGSFTADILISGSMIFILSQAKSQALWAQSERMIDRIIINVIQTGTLTVICAAVDLALFVALESSNLHVAPAIILGKLYSNSLLATLNLRNNNRVSTVVTPPQGRVAMRVQVSRFTERNQIDDFSERRLAKRKASDS